MYEKTTQNNIKTCITYSLWLIIAPPFLISCCILALLPAPVRYNNRLYYSISSVLGMLLTRTSFIRLHIQGKENIPQYPQTPAIIVMNHSSAFDIPIIEMLVGSYPHVWMSKASYKKIPLLGFLLNRMHVLVNRSCGNSALRALALLRNRIKNAQRHALLFPEGTRYLDGTVHTFLPGFAILACELNRPIIPVVTFGLNQVWPKKRFMIDSSSTQVKIVIGKPMYFPQDTPYDVVVTTVQHYFEKTLHTLRA